MKGISLVFPIQRAGGWCEPAGVFQASLIPESAA